MDNVVSAELESDSRAHQERPVQLEIYVTRPLVTSSYAGIGIYIVKEIVISSKHITTDILEAT
jgi:hypothetical protein